MRLAIPAATLAATLCCATPAAASWEERTTTWPVTEAIYNTCNHELVVFSGDWTEWERSRFDDGRIRIESEGRLRNGQGFVGGAGRAYVVQKTTSSKLDQRADKGVRRITQVETLVLRPKDARRGKKETLSIRRSSDVTESTLTGEYLGTPRDEYKAVCT